MTFKTMDIAKADWSISTNGKKRKENLRWIMIKDLVWEIAMYKAEMYNKDLEKLRSKVDCYSRVITSTKDTWGLLRIMQGTEVWAVNVLCTSGDSSSDKRKKKDPYRT